MTSLLFGRNTFSVLFSSVPKLNHKKVKQTQITLFMLPEMELPNRMKSALEREDLDLEASNEGDSESGQQLYNGYQGPLREAGDVSAVGGASNVGETGEDGSSVANSWFHVPRLVIVLVVVHLL
jgi:hypothetical protein